MQYRVFIEPAAELIILGVVDFSKFSESGESIGLLERDNIVGALGWVGCAWEDIAAGVNISGSIPTVREARAAARELLIGPPITPRESCPRVGNDSARSRVVGALGRSSRDGFGTSDVDGATGAVSHPACRIPTVASCRTSEEVGGTNKKVLFLGLGPIRITSGEGSSDRVSQERSYGRGLEGGLQDRFDGFLRKDAFVYDLPASILSPGCHDALAHDRSIAR